MQQRSLVLGLLLGLCSLLVAVQASHRGRIMGGEEATLNAKPFAASLRVDNAHVCGANIVAERKVLTAAHCLYRDGNLIAASRLSLRVGSTNQYAGGHIVTVDSATVHPDYYQLQNNLAVLTLTTALTYTDRIQAIEVAGSDDPLPAAGSEVSVAGWGRTTDGTTSYKIRELSLAVAVAEECEEAYSDPTGDSFCLAHELKEGTCHGDGGSGAVYQDKLIGLTNFVVGACGSRYPNVFVKLAPFSEWIQEQLA